MASLLQVYAAIAFGVVQVHLEDVCAVLQGGVAHVDLAVESACTEQGLVEHIGAVGGREYDDAAVVAEAVHLGEDLVEGVLAFVVAGKFALGAARTAYGINLVDEDDARTLLLSLTEEVAHAAGADTDEHLHEVGARH